MNKNIVEKAIEKMNISKYTYSGSNQEFKIDFDNLSEAVDFSNELIEQGFQGDLKDIFFENGKLIIRCI
jgi:hypothetical protein